MNRMRRSSRFALIAPLAIAGFALLIWLVMLLWNGVLTQATGVKNITYWQAAGIFLLSKILFGFGGGFGRRNRRSEMRAKFAKMTPEEKEKFKAEWKDRCRRWSSRSNQNDTNQNFQM